MNLRSILLVVLALILVGGTVFFAKSWLANQRAQVVESAPSAPAPKKLTEVLVARNDLPAGTFIAEGQLRWQPWPDENLAEGYRVRRDKSKGNEEELYGAVVRRGIAAGEPITSGRIVRAGDRGFLAAVLRPGYRAIAVSVDAASGIAGLVFPGDRVDIILTHVILEPKKDKDRIEHRASETVLTNVRVLALDQKVDDQNGEPRLAKTATLEVTPKQAEILVVARELGSLTLSLRALAKDEEELQRLANQEEVFQDPDPGTGESYTWDSEASLLVPPRGAATKDDEVIAVSHGAKVKEVRFQEGKRVASQDDSVPTAIPGLPGIPAVPGGQ
jgi:pilus assembly protein CpaB